MFGNFFVNDAAGMMSYDVVFFLPNQLNLVSIEIRLKCPYSAKYES